MEILSRQRVSLRELPRSPNIHIGFCENGTSINGVASAVFVRLGILSQRGILVCMKGMFGELFTTKAHPKYFLIPGLTVWGRRSKLFRVRATTVCFAHQSLISRYGAEFALQSSLQKMHSWCHNVFLCYIF